MAEENTGTEDAQGTENTEAEASQQVDTASLMDTEITENGEAEGAEEAKADEAPEAEAEAEGEKEAKAEDDTVPDEYAEFNVEEGVILDQDLVDTFKAEAKEEGLTQAQAQKRIDQAVNLSKTWTTKAIEAHQNQVNEWRDSTKTDPEIGGDKLAVTLAGAKQVRDAFGSKGLTEVLDTYGLGNHPEVIRFFSKVRSAISDDTFVKDGKPTGEPRRAADVFFGKTHTKQEG